MGQPISITNLEHSGAHLRRLASREKRGEVVRRLLALAMILEGHSRTEAAEMNGMDRQTLRDSPSRLATLSPSHVAWVKVGRRPQAKPARSGLDVGKHDGRMTEARGAYTLRRVQPHLVIIELPQP